jgi:hypothetical protein
LVELSYLQQLVLAEEGALEEEPLAQALALEQFLELVLLRQSLQPEVLAEHSTQKHRLPPVAVLPKHPVLLFPLMNPLLLQIPSKSKLHLQTKSRM